MSYETNDPLTGAVKKLFGLSYLSPYQRLVITNILEAASALGIPVNWQRQEAETAPAAAPPVSEELSDREALGRQIVILPTGAGKSLCFQLPAMLIDGLTLVIYPLLSLMADQERKLRERGFSPVVIRGGQTKEEREEIWGKLRRGRSNFIIANPEVLNTAQVRARLGEISVTHAVIDEAHCVSEWGESFRPAYLEIGAIIKLLNPPLITAFTATASAPVLGKIKRYIFGGEGARQIMGNPDRRNIRYSAVGCINRNLAVRDLLIHNARPAIVFCSSRAGAEKLARYLRNEVVEMGFKWHGEIKFYHAGLSGEEKAALESWFIKNPQAALVSTCAYGMGVDKADVRTVIHRDCAPSVEAYLQESGRAGRDGEQAKAILLFAPDDGNALARAKTEAERVRLSAMLRYARDAARCRRHALLALLDYDANGESPETRCCDVCENKAASVYREEASVCDFFRRNKRRYTAQKAAEVLAASGAIRWTREDAANVIYFLLKAGKLKKGKSLTRWKKITT